MSYVWLVVVGLVSCAIILAAYLAYAKRLDHIRSVHEMEMETAERLVAMNAGPENIQAATAGVSDMTRSAMQIPAFRAPAFGLNVPGIVEVVLNRQRAKSVSARGVPTLVDQSPTDLELPVGMDECANDRLPAGRVIAPGLEAQRRPPPPPRRV